MFKIRGYIGIAVEARSLSSIILDLTDNKASLFSLIQWLILLNFVDGVLLGAAVGAKAVGLRRHLRRLILRLTMSEPRLKFPFSAVTLGAFIIIIINLASRRSRW